MPTGCTPDLTIPTGRLAADQEGVRVGDNGGILFDLASALSEARFELPTGLDYGGQVVPIMDWTAVTTGHGDRVEGNIAIIANDLTQNMQERTATFIGFWEVPGGTVRETREVRFHIHVGQFF